MTSPDTPALDDPVEAIERGRLTADELSWSLRAVNRAAAEVDTLLAGRLGLRPLDFAALGHVMSAESTHLGPAELGQRVGISTGSATELVDRLERAGHVARARASSDRRRVSIVPQQQAIDRLLRELGPLLSSLDALAGEFSSDEQAAIQRYLRLAAERLTAYGRSLTDSEHSDAR